MRKLILIMLVFVSCNTNNTSKPINQKPPENKETTTVEVTKPQQEYPKEIYWTNAKHDSRKAFVVKIENHEYMYGYVQYDSPTFFFTHYHDCKFCKKEHDEMVNKINEIYNWNVPHSK
jgi:hypothetical protein